jgi:hypothetical protein
MTKHISEFYNVSTSREDHPYEDYEQKLVKQIAADALQQHSYMIMHALSHHEPPFRMRLRMLKVLSGLPHSLRFWLLDEASETTT